MSGPRILLWGVVGLLFGLVLLSMVVEEGLLEAPVWVIIGWIPYIYRARGTVAFDWMIVMGAVACLAAFAVGLHLLCRWLYRARSGEQGRQWRAGWSGAMAALILVVFVAGVSMFALAHQLLWLARAPVPLYTSAYPRAFAMKCASNMHSIGLATKIYCASHDGRYPAALAEILEEDLVSSAFVCPATSDRPAEGPTTREIAEQLSQPGHCSYIYVGQGLVDPVPDAAHRVILYEQPANHEGRGVNMLFADWHVEWMSGGRAQAELDRATTRPAAQEHGEVP